MPYYMTAGLDRFCVRLEREVRPPLHHPAPAEPNHGQAPGRLSGTQVLYLVFLSIHLIFDFLYLNQQQPLPCEVPL